MRPNNLKTKIFLDSGDPSHTKEALGALGFLDGQTTNPSLVAKHPEVQKCLLDGRKCTEEEILGYYKDIVTEISSLLPEGSVSVEVYADLQTGEDQMFSQGKDMYNWIDNAHIKYPTNRAGLKAAHRSIAEDMRVNMTLCFGQSQAAAVYAATADASMKPVLQGGLKQVFVSPFIGRLDDRGENGMDLIKNVLEMYKSGDGHVEVLVASVRNMDHFLYSLQLGADIITAPLKILKEWAGSGLKIPDADYKYPKGDLTDIVPADMDLGGDCQSFDITHPLVEQGVEKFAADWNRLIGSGT